MLKSRVRVIHAFLAGVACLAAAPEPEQAPSALLERLGRVSLLYTDTVLRFSCDETLRSSPGGTFKDSYIYVFGEDGRFHDYRTRRGSKNGAEIPPDKVPTRRYLTQALSWVFQFHPARHGRIAFTFMGEDSPPSSSRSSRSPRSKRESTSGTEPPGSIRARRSS
jgi:hypothetical protein